MIELARKRNAEHVAAGRAAFITASLADADLGERRFDKVLAVHVAAFWTRPVETLGVVRRHLAPGGRVYLANQGPGASGEHIAAVLKRHGFRTDEVRVSGIGVCVISSADE